MDKINSSLNFAPLHRLHRLRSEKKITTVELVNYYLERISSYDKQLNCFLATYPELALASAKQADQRLQKGEQLDPVCGFPLAVKDIISTKDIITSAGSKILADYRPPYDATLIAKLKKLNYGLIGKTNLDEFAMGSSTEHSAFGPTLNPWNKKFVPGGSSGGSAAAVAADFCAAAIGTDTGGSVRQPAGFCGVVGLKPTYGLVSRYGLAAYGSSLDQAGILAKDVTDAGLILERIAGYDPADATSFRQAKVDFRIDAPRDLAGLKIGVIDNLDLQACTLEVQQNFADTLNLLEKKGRAKIKRLPVAHIEHAIAAYYIIAMAEASSNLSRYDGVRYGLRQTDATLGDMYFDSRSAGFGAEVKLRILMGTFVLSAGYYESYYGKALELRAALMRELKDVFSTVDVLALPISPTAAFSLATEPVDPLKMYLNDAFTVPANLAGIPGLSLPSGRGSNNLPLGFQLLANNLGESLLLKVGLWLEKNEIFPASKLDL